MNGKTGYKFEPKKFFLFLPIYLIVAFALYVLSLGPMYWTVYEAFFLRQGSPIALLYLPLVWMSEWEPFGRWLEWYVGLWVL